MTTQSVPIRQLSQSSRVLAVVVVTLLFAINVFVSYVAAALSINLTVMGIFAVTNAVCFCLAIHFAVRSLNRWLAVVFVLAPVPVSVAISVMFAFSP